MLALTNDDKQRIRNGLIRRCELLHPGAFVVCQILSSYASEYTRGDAKLSHRTLAIQSGYSKRKIAKVLEVLQECNLIVKKNKNHRGQVGVYALIFSDESFAKSANEGS